MKTGLAIAIRREQIGMSQVDLANAVGVSKATICRWESGDISNMRRDRIQKLAEALKVSPISLLDEETDGLFSDAEKPLEPIALRASVSDWIKILNGMSDDNLIKLRDYARLLLLQQHSQAEKGDQGSPK